MLSKSFIFLTLIAFSYANMLDFLKFAKHRTFNSIEGKVPVVKIIMDENDFKKMNETVQISMDDIITKYNLHASLLPIYETKVTMLFEVDGETKTFEKVNFKTGGQWARIDNKVGFNLKLKGDDRLFDRKNLRIRPDAVDATHIRSKLAIDLINNWNIPTVQTAFIEFYINDIYFGLYNFLDAIKPAWAESYFNYPKDKEVTSLFQCKQGGMDFTPTGGRCLNEKDEYLNNTKAYDEMILAVTKSQTIDDIAKVLDIELMMKNIVIEFLYASFDHFLFNGHNFYLFQENEGSKWKMIEYDFDKEFGNGIGTYFHYFLKKELKEPAHMKFLEYEKSHKHIVDVIYNKDNTYFKTILRELLITGFNPENIFPRVDELVKFVAPYVEKSFIPNPDGSLPGTINKVGNAYPFTMDSFYGNSNYDSVTVVAIVPGIKDFVQKKFDFVINEYGLDKQEIIESARIYRKTGKIPKIEIVKKGKKCIVKVIQKKKKNNN